MAVIDEDFDSRPQTVGLPVGNPNSEAELKYSVIGTADDDEVKTLVEATIPAFFAGLPFDTYTIDPKGGVPGKELWKVVAKYKSKHDIYETSFSTTGGTAKITQSLETVSSVGITSILAPDFKKAIGVGQDTVEGVDITVPVMNLQVKQFRENVTQDYVSILFDLTGKTNNATFRGFDAGELLFLGADGSRKGGDAFWELTLKFAASPNKENITIDTVTVDKKGWEYLWIRYVDVELAGFLIKQPGAVYVERVYEEGDFEELDLEAGEGDPD